MKFTTQIIKNASLVFITLLALSACGQKGPLILEKQPVDATQAPLENSNDVIPVETPSEISNANSDSE